MSSIVSHHDWHRALRMASYGFLLYGPGSYAWYKYLDHCLPQQTAQNIMLKVQLFRFDCFSFHIAMNFIVGE